MGTWDFLSGATVQESMFIAASLASLFGVILMEGLTERESGRFPDKDYTYLKGISKANTLVFLAVSIYFVCVSYREYRNSTAGDAPANGIPTYDTQPGSARQNDPVIPPKTAAAANRGQTPEALKWFFIANSLTLGGAAIRFWQDRKLIHPTLVEEEEAIQL